MNSLIKNFSILSSKTLSVFINNKNYIPVQTTTLLNNQFSTLINANKINLLSQNNNNNVMEQQIREYKAKMRLRKRCRSCYFMWKNGRIYVECKTYPSHKQHHKFCLELGYDHLAHGYHDPTTRKIPVPKTQPQAS
jgi:ribosomal protein L36